MAITLTTTLKDRYADLLKKQLEQAQKQAEAQKIPYQYNISQAGTLYQPLKNDAYTQNMAAQRALREKLANYGLAGGTALRQNQNLASNLASALTNVDLQRQRYLDEQNTAMSQIDAQTQSDIAGIKAQNELEMQKALMEQQNIEMQRALALYLAGRISKSQFQKLTGVKW